MIDKISQPDIRPTRPDSADFRAVENIERRAFPDDKYFGYNRNIALPGVINLITAINGASVGFVTVLTTAANPAGNYLWQRMRPYVGCLAVVPEFERRGIGKTLMKRAMKDAFVQKQYDFMYLECDPTKDKSNNFYKKLGFTALTSEEIIENFGMPPHPTRVVYRGAFDIFNNSEI